jgi:hypothetical protein
VQGVKNKAADGLSRAHDTGLIKCDDQVTNKHPALEYLGAPPIEEGSIKLEAYLDRCERYVQKEWPILLERYKEGTNDKADLENVEIKIDKETSYVNRLADATTHLHSDRVAAKQRQFCKIDQKTNEIENEQEIHLDSETTDGKMKTIGYCIRMLAINNSCFSYRSFLALQEDDEFCQEKLELVKKNDLKIIRQGFLKKKGLLMRKFTTSDGQVYYTVCIPRVIVPALLNATHGNLMSGHLGKEKFYVTLRKKFYWPKMREDIVRFHEKCVVCQYNDKYPVKFKLGYVIRPMYPLHIVHCDLVVGLPRAVDKSYAIMLLYDGFSRHVFGIPLASEKASYVVRKFMSHYVSAYGLMWALHSDNARNLDGSFMRHLTSLLGVVKTSTPPHNAQSNPTETMCGAIAMLLRKGLQDSDKKYWPYALPLLLNAINNSVHTATGYTPNELFLGHFTERSMVPLVPHETESANVTEYHQKMRRFQEVAFQIARARNEKRIQAKKQEWDKTAKTHNYEIGDFVVIKNQNPASGIGKMKLRTKYIGPFRIIKVYPASLVVVPWTENARLEDYYRDPDLFRYIHRGDIKPFHTRQVAVRDCKPYKAETEEQKVIDPIILDQFLSKLNLDNNEEILSVIDKDIDTESVTKFDYRSSISNRKEGEENSELELVLEDSTEKEYILHSEKDKSSREIYLNPQGVGAGSSAKPATADYPSPPSKEAGSSVVSEKQPMGAEKNPLNRSEGLDSSKNGSSESSITLSSKTENFAEPELTEKENSVVEIRSESTESGSYHLSQLFELIEIDDEIREKLQDKILNDQKVTSSNPSSSSKSSSNKSLRLQFEELEKLIVSPNDDIRHQAEFELGKKLEQLLVDQEKELAEKEEVKKTVEPTVSSETSRSIKEKEAEKEPSLSSKDSDSVETAVSEKEIESDEDSLESVTSYKTRATNLSKDSWPGTNDPTVKPSEGRARIREPIVNIRTRGYAVTISPEEYHPPARHRAVPRVPTGRNRSEVQDWVYGYPLTPQTPTVDRRGRVIKPKTRYDPEDEEQRHRDLRQQARQRALATQAMSTPRVENLVEDTSLKEVGEQEDFSGAISTKARTQKKSNFGSRKTPSKRS